MASTHYLDGYREGERGDRFSPPAFTLHCQEYSRGYGDGKAGRYSRFRLLSQTTVFEVERFYAAAGFIPSVVGYTLDGSHKTCARLADILWLEEA